MLSTILAAIQKLLTNALNLIFSVLSRLGTFLENAVDDLFAFLGSILA